MPLVGLGTGRVSSRITCNVQLQAVSHLRTRSPVFELTGDGQGCRRHSSDLAEAEACQEQVSDSTARHSITNDESVKCILHFHKPWIR